MWAVRRRLVYWGILLSILAFIIGHAPLSLLYNELANDHYEKAYPVFFLEPEEQWDREKPIRDWHARVERKYRRAVFLPWLPVEPDSPMPDKPSEMTNH